MKKKKKEILMYIFVLGSIAFAAFYEIRKENEMVFYWEARGRKGWDYEVFSGNIADDVIKVHKTNTNDISGIMPGKEVLISKRLIHSNIESVGRDLVSNQNYIFFGKIIKIVAGVDWSLDGEFKLTVNQNENEKTLFFDSEWFFIVLEKGEEAKLTFQKDGYITKNLTVVKGVDKQRSPPFRTTCVFKEGTGVESAVMNLDSLSLER
jgi:hypothetical protein